LHCAVVIPKENSIVSLRDPKQTLTLDEREENERGVSAFVGISNSDCFWCDMFERKIKRFLKIEIRII
jgi:hypothetical protein